MAPARGMAPGRGMAVGGGGSCARGLGPGLVGAGDRGDHPAFQPGPPLHVLERRRRDLTRRRPHLGRRPAGPAHPGRPGEAAHHRPGAAAGGVPRAAFPARRGRRAGPGAAVPVHQQQLLGHAVALQRHPDAHRLRGRDRRAGPHPGPGGQAPGPGGQAPAAPGLPALEQGLGRQARGRGGQEPGWPPGRAGAPGRRAPPRPLTRRHAPAGGWPGTPPWPWRRSRPCWRSCSRWPACGTPRTYQVTPMSGPNARQWP